MRYYCLIMLTMFAANIFAQGPDTVFLKNLLISHPELFAGVMKHPIQNEVQILYTQINRDKYNIPHFKSYSYRLNAGHYFYPASTVKLPTLIFALEKLNELHINGLNKDAVMLTDSSFNGQTKVNRDTTAKTGLPSIANYIKKILLVSDNDAYNRLYEFVGREELNKKLKKYGLANSRIMSRLAVGDGGENARHTNTIRFYNNGMLVYTKPAQTDTNNYPIHASNLLQGKGYMDKYDQLIMQPFDFSNMNVYPLSEQQMVLKRLLFPEAFTVGQRFNFTADDRKFVYRYMSMYPTESDYPAYRLPAYFLAYCKFLFYGGDSSAVIDPAIRIFNKVGDSYGYDIDNAYIVDFKTKTEFLLTAVIQSNEDGIYNDNKYEYATVCLPFLKNIGRLIYQYELQRYKKYLPDLSQLQSAIK